MCPCLKKSPCINIPSNIERPEFPFSEKKGRERHRDIERESGVLFYSILFYSILFYSYCNYEQAIPCEEENCCVKEGVIQDKSESDQNPNITQALAATPLDTQRAALELCWYCLKSFSIEELNIPQVENEASILSSSGERVKYLRDPRPHFGVAHSSRSVSFPLWDGDRPREIKEGEDDEEEKGVDSVSCCPHCHLGLPRDTLRWHEGKCLLFEGVRNSSI
ncbi:hypothetical protein IRJ41_006734 [Triplophysa rosa]|uniref:Uncharacterized protein n=1 Tax=Triplophysa rosa TaxID=992332 RepID=A0A9W7TAF0_TRIRA|nr:hypothetical protein IRJ41_006734 [Triplophysa rosa]